MVHFGQKKQQTNNVKTRPRSEMGWALHCFYANMGLGLQKLFNEMWWCAYLIHAISWWSIIGAMWWFGNILIEYFNEDYAITRGATRMSTVPISSPCPIECNACNKSGDNTNGIVFKGMLVLVQICEKTVCHSTYTACLRSAHFKTGSRTVYSLWVWVYLAEL